MVTLREIATAAGVNISTVSRALSGDRSISERTRESVKAIAKELNYRPNVNAQVLAGKGSRMVGMIMPEIDSNYFARLVHAVESSLRAHGYSLMIANTQYVESEEARAVENFRNYNIEGLFIASSIHSKHLQEMLKSAAYGDMAVVLLEALPPHVDHSSVVIDDTHGLVEAIAYLVDQGHTRIGYLSDPLIDQIRVPMFKEALRRNGLSPEDNPVYSHPSTRFERAGYETMNAILEQPGYPSAFLAGYDNIAIGAIRAINEHGLQVPEDIAIIGNDNIREAPYLHRALSTLSPPVEKMASLGVDLLLKSIRGKADGQIHQVTLRPELILRETA